MNERLKRTAGRTNPGALLTAEAVRKIRMLYIPRDPTNGAKALAEEYRVSPAAISKVVCGKNWKVL